MVAQPCRGLVAVAVGQFVMWRAPPTGASSSPSIRAAASRRFAYRRRGRRGARGTARAHAPGRRVRGVPGGRSGGAGAQPREPREQVGRLDGVGARAERPDWLLPLGATIEARKRLVGQDDPPPPLRKLRPAVVRRCVRGSSAVHAPRLQVVRALDVVDRGGQRDHLLDARPQVGAVEVLACPSAQIHRRADVEHLVGGSAEQVDAGPVRQVGGEDPLAPLLRRTSGRYGAGRCRCARPGCRPVR